MTQPPGGPYGGPGSVPPAAAVRSAAVGGRVRAAGVRAARGRTAPAAPAEEEPAAVAHRRRRRAAVRPGDPPGGPAPRRRLARHGGRRHRLPAPRRRRRPRPTRAPSHARPARRCAGRRGAAETDQSRYEGSADAALAWVQAMAEGEFQTAYDLSCADVQASAAAAAAGEDPAFSLGTYFFEQTLGGQGFSDGTFDSILYSEAVRHRRRVVHPAAGRRRGVPAAGLRAARREGLRLPLRTAPAQAVVRYR